MSYTDALTATIAHNADDEDEFAAGGFSQEPAFLVQVPRIKESFLSLECKTRQVINLSEAGTTALVIGEVQHVALDEEYANDVKKRYGENGFMLLVHSPFNYQTCEFSPAMAATLKLQKET